MFIANILLGLTCVIAFFLGLFIIISNPRKSENRVLASFIFAICIWLLSNLVTNLSADPGQALFFARTTFIGPILLSYLFYVFVRVFIATEKNTPWYLFLVSIPALLLLSITFTKLNVESISAYGANTKVGVAYTLLIPVILTYITFGLMSLIRFYKRSSDSVKKVQIRYIFAGAVAAIVPGLIINGILPVFGNYAANLYGPNAVIFLAIFMSIAIVKHRLLDIRLIVARSLTYALLLAVVVIFYGIIIFGIGSKILPSSQLNLFERLFYVTFAILMALSYQPLKKFFDKITNKFFFQDVYNTQEVLDNVSSVIVGSVDPHKIQRGALNALSTALRPTFMSFLLFTAGDKLIKGDVVGQQWNMHNPKILQAALKKSGKKFIIYDEPDEHNEKLREILRIEEISLVAPLVTKDETIGYLLLGPKKSGNIYNTQDIGLLNIATNEMAVALQNAQRFDEIQAFALTMQEKVTEATRELKTSNRKLIALDEAKDEFISMASHQLRTPLTSIKGYLSMLSDGDMGKLSPAQMKAVQEAFGSSQRMVFLIADFLNVSRIKTGKFVIEPSKIDLSVVVGEELSQLKEMFESKNLKLSYEPPHDLPQVMLDDNKMRQVMMNMIDNAIYYTPVGGSINVQLYKTDSELIFKVVDNGIGVSKAEQHKLFTKFFRASNAKKARPDGTGLGLFMAQKIVVEQGGAIIFESTENKGSTFGFRFPLSKIRA